MIAKLQQLRLSALFHFRRDVMRAPVKVHHVRNPFHAVSIVMDKRCACGAAKALEGVRFLASEAPRLPLASCAVQCTCRYQHHADRRQDSRRASDGKWSPPSRVYDGAERRRDGRRIDDE